MTVDVAAKELKKKKSQAFEISLRARILRFLLHYWALAFNFLLTRTRVEGVENIPEEGPVIFAGNHASTYDVVLLNAFLPRDTQYVGPGDFRLRWPNRLVSEYTDVILVKRGSTDTKSLQAMQDVLKKKGRLVIFPEGGTWEKSLYNVKPGVPYLSMLCNATIVPIALSGTYDVWKDIFKLKRPVMHMRFGEPIPPVPKVDRKNRREVLENTSKHLMDTIYSMLEKSERDRYDYYTYETYTGAFQMNSAEGVHDVQEGFPVIAELVSKKNLFSSFHEHAGLPLKPLLRHSRDYPYDMMYTALDALHEALLSSFQGYLTYRLGAEKEQAAVEELATMKALLEEHQPRTVRFTPTRIDLRDEHARQEQPEQQREELSAS